MTQATPGLNLCIIPGCGRPVHCRDWCKPHYSRWQKTGTVGDAPIRARSDSTECLVEGCTRLTHCQGYCRRHYERWRKTGSPGDAEIQVQGRTGCLVEGCDREHYSKGHCKPHYYRLRRTGEIGDAEIEARYRTTWAEDSSEATCWSCGETKPAEDFYMQGTDPASRLYGRRQGRCKECVKAAGQEWRGENPDLIRERQVGYRLKFFFDLTPAQYEALLAAQGGGCGICGQTPQSGKKRLHVDHDHETGAIRGVLCSQCNTSLGLFGEDIRMLTRAAEYLECGAA